MTNYVNEIQRRRTFAIISHPDAGKTTLTEKLLLYGGAIQGCRGTDEEAVQGMSAAKDTGIYLYQQNGPCCHESV